MYVIESIDTYTQRREFFAGLDQVTRRALWSRELQDQAVHFADRRSAELFNTEALLGRPGQVVTA